MHQTFHGCFTLRHSDDCLWEPCGGTQRTLFRLVLTYFAPILQTFRYTASTNTETLAVHADVLWYYTKVCFCYITSISHGLIIVDVESARCLP